MIDMYASRMKNLEGYFELMGYRAVQWPGYGTGSTHSLKRKNLGKTVLEKPLKKSIIKLNPGLPPEVLREAFLNITNLPRWELIAVNEYFHKMLTHGIPVEYREHDELIRVRASLVDFENTENNRYNTVSYFPIEEGESNDQLDLVVFINGLPLVVIAFLEEGVGENRNADLHAAFNRVQRWKEQFPSLFRYNALLIITDGVSARVGSLSAGYSRFTVWRSLSSLSFVPRTINSLQVLVAGLLEKKTLLDMIKHFTVFEKTKRQDTTAGMMIFHIDKKIAGYHQYYAVNSALESTVRAASISGDQRCGVVWHTQGSGKSMTMLFYAAKLTILPTLENPTIVVITDRSDLDDQLFETFAASVQLLGQAPIQAVDRTHLKQLLKINSGGILFTTVQKFFPCRGRVHPLLSRRRNIIVIADEAHRSQYDFIDGYARHMRDALPNASFIGFTGTPLEKDDRNTRTVFGRYIDVYDVQRAVDDGATVPIYYEGRLVDVTLREGIDTFIDDEFEAVTRHRNTGERKRLKRRWTRLEAVLGCEKRVRTICRDLVDHFEQRQTCLPGKAMVVCISRRVCIDFYNEIIRLRPDWHSDDDLHGTIKVVITGSSLDPAEWHPHIRDKTRRRVIGDRLKNPADPLKIVIVCDMWLTGFDAPCLHTLYIDKPLKEHILMQAIARVNRVFRDKSGGLVVDYLGIADHLRQALAVYIESGGNGRPYLEQADAVALMEEKYELVSQIINGFSYRQYLQATPSQKEGTFLNLQEHLLALDKGKETFNREVDLLSRAFTLSVPHPAALRLRDEIGFFQDIRARLNAFKADVPQFSGNEVDNGKSNDEDHGNAVDDAPDRAVETAMRQIVSTVLVTGKVVDAFDAAGLKKPGVSILSEEFLRLIRMHSQSHVAVELLKKLLKEEITARVRMNMLAGRSFKYFLNKIIRLYRRKKMSTLAVIEILTKLARELRQFDLRGCDLELTADELMLYNALTSNEKTLRLIPDEILRDAARKLVEVVRKKATLDWAVRDSIRARLRVGVRRTLRNYNFPLEALKGTIDMVMRQTEFLAGVYCRECDGERTNP
jgi:type I restriction enzyme R subunit